MPSIKLSPRLTAWLVAMAVAGCAGLGSVPTSAEFARLPRDIRTGAADTVIAPVEREVSPDEVNAAVSRIVSASPVCMTWPSLWLDSGVSARNIYRARFDRMKRDWGVPVAIASQQRMDEYVDMGFLTKRARDDIGPDVIEYTLTDLGRSYLSGSPYGGERSTFCAPSERQLVAVTRMDPGQFPCGTLQVHFTFQATNPSWARTDAARQRAAQSSDAPSQGEGVVTLGRQWFRPDVLPAGTTNGSLQSVCYDLGHRNIVGNDLNLNAGGS